jgi:hypothetical protein
LKLGGRSIWQVLGLYLAVGWVLLQVVDVLVAPADRVELLDRFSRGRTWRSALEH